LSQRRSSSLRPSQSRTVSVHKVPANSQDVRQDVPVGPKTSPKTSFKTSSDFVRMRDSLGEAPMRAACPKCHLPTGFWRKQACSPLSQPAARLWAWCLGAGGDVLRGVLSMRVRRVFASVGTSWGTSWPRCERLRSVAWLTIGFGGRDWCSSHRAGLGWERGCVGERVGQHPGRGLIEVVRARGSVISHGCEIIATVSARV
jgi:hypothetical protein